MNYAMVLGWGSQIGLLQKFARAVLGRENGNGSVATQKVAR